MLFFGGEDLTPFQFTCLASAGTLAAGAAAFVLAGPAHRAGLVSRHRRDRFGSGRVPLVGGPALALGALVPLAALGFPLSPGQALACLVFFAVGLLDDMKELKPAPKFALQGAAAIAAAWCLVPPAYLAFAAILLLFLVNACNYLDNMDGLLPGIALMQAIALVLLDITPSTGAPLLLWALPAVLFLAGRVYLGDSGSHLVGALLGIDALRCLLDDAGGVRGRFLVPLLLLFAPQLADVLTVTVSRLVRKRPVFRGGTDHLSHRLVRAGFPVPKAVLVLVLASAVCGAASFLLSR
jgi:UDP-GlcNAc:undecaprenyl-phosphate/decaprenyl-phosphate GlcNAc-1-phosphate transferase